MADDSDKLVAQMMKETALRDSHKDDVLIVGLDFGTTYSGVAYAFTSEPESIRAVTNWPNNKGSEKCPTLIRYDSSTQISWGFELEHSLEARIEGIKLLLDPSQPRPTYAPTMHTAAELERLGKSAVSVATDYVSAILEHSNHVIEASHPKDFLERVERRYVLSVPAVWSDKAKDATCRAARNAGINNISLIKEPEAAALCTIRAMKNQDIKVGDALVICDAGGGTVDLISYEVENVHPLQLKELTKATGGLAGSLMVNQCIESRLKDAFGDVEFVKLKEKPTYRSAMRTFEKIIKPGFSGQFDDDQYLHFPAARLKNNPAKGIKDGMFIVTGELLYKIFEPLVVDIKSLVAYQVNQVRAKRLKARHPQGDQIKAILLVGGFGSNDYLYESIKKAHQDIQVIQPPQAWSAIVRGAVMSRLPTEARVTTNVAPKHYGAEMVTRYIKGSNKDRKKFYNYLEDEWLTDAIKWYIEKGEDLRRARKIEFPFYCSFDHEPVENDLVFTIKLFECNLESAPDYFKSGLVTTNCTLKADLQKLPRDLIVKKARWDASGKMIPRWEVHYEVQVTIQSGPMRFSLMANGVEYGNIESEY